MSAYIGASLGYHAEFFHEKTWLLAADLLCEDDETPSVSGSLTIYRFNSEGSVKYRVTMSRSMDTPLKVVHSKMEIRNSSKEIIYEDAHAFEDESESCRPMPPASAFEGDTVVHLICKVAPFIPDLPEPAPFKCFYRTDPENMPFVDLVLQCQGVEIRCHKLVLVLQSEVFETMLNQDPKEAKIKTLPIENMDPRILRMMVAWCYTLQLPQLTAYKIQLFAAACRFDIPLLRSACRTGFIADIDVASAADLFLLAHRHGMEEVQEATCEIIRANYDQVVLAEGWANIKANPEALDSLFRIMCSKGQQQ